VKPAAGLDTRGWAHWRKQWYEFDVSGLVKVPRLRTGLNKQDSNVYNRWHNQQVFIPPHRPIDPFAPYFQRTTPVRRTPQSGVSSSTWMACSPDTSGTRAGSWLMEEEDIPFDREANDGCRVVTPGFVNAAAGWAAGLRRRAPEMMAQNGCYEKFIQGLTWLFIPGALLDELSRWC